MVFLNENVVVVLLANLHLLGKIAHISHYQSLARADVEREPAVIVGAGAVGRTLNGNRGSDNRTHGIAHHTRNPLGLLCRLLRRVDSPAAGCKRLRRHAQHC